MSDQQYPNGGTPPTTIVLVEPPQSTTPALADTGTSVGDLGLAGLVVLVCGLILWVVHRKR